MRRNILPFNATQKHKADTNRNMMQMDTGLKKQDALGL